jgi:glutamyl-tRNA synthetase
MAPAMNATVRTRFAPSPTGYLHVGNVRTALFNALAARSAHGAFLLRIEDSDRARSKPEFVDALYDDLAWLGIEWQEKPVEQSARGSIYDKYVERLIGAGRAYPCFCTPAELAAARERQLAAGLPPRYAGTCAALAQAEIEARIGRGEQPAWRFRVPSGTEVAFDDVVRGMQRFATDTIGDFVIRRADGTPAFFFCNALDDALMQVTLVLRGEDHLANTPRQILLLEALEFVPPRYGHLGLLVGADGTPLSKRHGSASLRDLRHEGFLPGAVVNYLARLGHSYTGEPGYADFAGLAAGFDLKRLGASPAHFDRDQLLHWQKEAVAHADDSELWAWMTANSDLAALVPAEEQGAFVQAIRDNIVLPGDALSWARALYTGDADSEAEDAIRTAGKIFFDTALKLIDDAADARGFVKVLGAAAGVKGPALYQPLRAALTGRLHGPELARIWELLGRVRIRARLEAALKTVAEKS